DKAIGYGMEGVQVDGNNVLDVYDTVKKYATSMRENPRPILLEAMTFRMRGHEEASGTKYVPKELMETWAKKDPIENYQRFLLEEKVIDEKYIDTLRKKLKKEIDTGIQIGNQETYPEANTQRELD